MTHTETYLRFCHSALDGIDANALERIVIRLRNLRSSGGRLFFLGSGGGAGHASHAVNDFRKIAGIECYTPTDNVSELTARINDDGWDTCFSEWLKGSRLGPRDALFVFSVGGGDAERNISINIVRVIEYAQEVKAAVFGIVGRDGGFTARCAEECIVVPTVDPAFVTPLTEGLQAVLWHAIVCHPGLQDGAMKWESVSTKNV